MFSLRTKETAVQIDKYMWGWILSRRVHRDLPLCSKSSAKVEGMQKQRDPLRLIVPSVFDPETTAVLSVPRVPAAAHLPR